MRFYYGWWIVAVSMLVLMLALGTTMNAFGLFVLPVSEDFGLTRANVNTGLILTNLGIAAISPFIGRMLDIYPARRIMALSALIFGGSFVILGFSRDIWLSGFVLALPLAVGIAGVGSLTSVTLVARWFNAQRGRAMALTTIGMSLGTVLMAPLVGLMIVSFGWRLCLIVLGVVLAAVFLACVPFIRERPGPDDVEPVPAGTAVAAQPVPETPGGGTSFKPAQLLRMPHFLALVFGAALAMGALQTIAVSIVPLAQENGVSVSQSATLLSMLGAMAVVGKLVLVWLGDRLDRTLTLSILFSLVALASIALLFGNSYVTLLGCSALLGLVAGAMMPIFLALVADRVGVASFGTANGAAAFIMATTGALAIRFGGEVYDRTGGYDAMFITFGAVALLAGALVFLSGRLARARHAAAPAGS